MTAMGHVTNAHSFPIDFSNRMPEVLDLSRSKRKHNDEYYHRISSKVETSTSYPSIIGGSQSRHSPSQDHKLHSPPQDHKRHSPSQNLKLHSPPQNHKHFVSSTHEDHSPSHEEHFRQSLLFHQIHPRQNLLQSQYSQQSPTVSPHSSPNTYSQTVAEQFNSNESLNNFYSVANRSPSMYSNDGKDIPSPHNNTPTLLSPTLSAHHAAPEQITPYIINAALQQTLILQSKRVRNSESDGSSEAGSEGIPSHMPKYPLINTGREGKVTRPFKAYPKDPMTLASNLTPIDALIDQQSAERYAEFRRLMIKNICEANGGSATVTNPKMRRTIATAGNSDGAGTSTGERGDETYVERRMKNNAAAKKSRDRRRIKEDEIAIRAAFLEKENLELKVHIATVKKYVSMHGLPFPEAPKSF